MNTNYYDWESPGIGRNVFFSTVVGIVLCAVVLLIEYRVFAQIRYKVQQRKRPLPPYSDTPEDSDIIEEKERVARLTPEQITNTSLVVKGITKYYQNFLAVNNLSLGTYFL